MAQRGKELEIAMASLHAEKSMKKERRMKSSRFPKSEPVLSNTHAYATPVQQHPNSGTRPAIPQAFMPRHPQPYQHQQPLPAAHQQIPLRHEQHLNPVAEQGSMDSFGSVAAAAGGPYGWRQTPLQVNGEYSGQKCLCPSPEICGVLFLPHFSRCSAILSIRKFTIFASLRLRIVKLLKLKS